MTKEVITPPKPSKIKKVSARKMYVKGLIYGEPGAGKTYLACTAPKPLVLLTEPAVSDSTMLAVKRDLGVDPDVWEILEWNDLEEAFEYLQSAQHPYETVVIDSLTDLYRRVMRLTINNAVEKRPQHDPDVPEKGDWFRVQERVRYIARMFRDLPMHVIFTALVMDIRNEVRRVPLVQPKSLAQELPAYCNLVGYLGVQEINGEYVRKLLVEPTDVYAAKNPGGALPPIVENPNLRAIFDQITTLGITKGEVNNAKAIA
ncbi:ATP-binding protein [Gelria sp. Kuro-4]|uniref:ATP-binding protein n=1 Tax=Gelria sp. Kuro-4 TaxID=2796927 RepID=UPI001BEF0792|nr:ATP-binding protein [Gelria sp. Kuro-4]BCV23331.1 hypothetical protein kuro4_01040 [Gelria sp. Kuro-4]